MANEYTFSMAPEKKKLLQVRTELLEKHYTSPIPHTSEQEHGGSVSLWLVRA